ncbi:MAG TPA: orotidine-5'-phosphate decarboxylase [Actinomycetota bacterium]|nr:orotidine-5'-phosphate decarboxylase [Actinomycetota bacterium]
MTTLEPPVCIALDVPGYAEAGQIVKELSGLVGLFKVGLELFCAEGPRTVEAVRQAGAKVFLDLKVHDIPRTAAAAVREAGRIGATYLTIHGFGGRDMIRAASETAKENGGPQLLVVTALTSLDDARLAEIGVRGTVREHALRIGTLAAEEGADGLVLSPRELDVVRTTLPHLQLCTPGVRPQGSSVDDHQRSLTPAEAILAGADLLVIGRPVLQASDRRAAASEIVRQVQEAEGQREARRRHDSAASVQEAEDAEFVEEGVP